MRLYQEQSRLRDAQRALQRTNFCFGPNKKQELLRLIYEISRRDNIPAQIILKKALEDNSFQSTKHVFAYLKDYFLKKRFPETYEHKKNFDVYLPKINLNSRYAVLKKEQGAYSPKAIFIEREIKDYGLTKSILTKFPHAQRILISRLKDYIKSNQSSSPISNYNLRTRNLFLINERFDFIKPCPCSQGVLSCGYYILNLGFGCIYECSYCFLQSYTNVNGIIVPVNVENFLNRLDLFIKDKRGPLRIGTGEFTDSLALDDITAYSCLLIDLFSRFKNATLELKTKSNKIKHILKLKHNRKTVIAWSLNPQQIIDSDEWQTSDLNERLEAARECCQAGYLVAFHFDPIIYSTNWEKLYRGLIDNLFKKINPKDIAWISLGTFRFMPQLKTIIEQRFPQSKILDKELILGFDRKLRYPLFQRIRIYKKMLSWIRRYSGSVLVYLCMEPKGVWKEILGRTKF